jgi:hypothetical protein
MGAISRSAAATALASISIFGVAAITAGHLSALSPRATEDSGPIIICADSMVWDGHQCVVIVIPHP